MSRARSYHIAYIRGGGVADIHGVRPGKPVILTVAVKNAAAVRTGGISRVIAYAAGTVFHAVKQMQSVVVAHYHNGVVHGLADFGPFSQSDRLTPRIAAVRAAEHLDIHVGPVAAGHSGLVVHDNGVLLCDNNAWYAVIGILCISTIIAPGNHLIDVHNVAVRVVCELDACAESILRIAVAVICCYRYGIRFGCIWQVFKNITALGCRSGRFSVEGDYISFRLIGRRVTDCKSGCAYIIYSYCAAACP